MSAAIYWKVGPAPTGRCRSFQRRGWPTAYYKGSGKPAFFLESADDYEPQAVKAGTHAPIYVVACHHNHPSSPNSWARLKMRDPFATLDAAKAACLAALNEKPELAPVAKSPRVLESTEATLAGVMLELMQILAYRKKGGSQLVLSMREPEILARCVEALGRAGVTEADTLATVKEAEGWA